MIFLLLQMLTYLATHKLPLFMCIQKQLIARYLLTKLCSCQESFLGGWLRLPCPEGELWTKLHAGSSAPSEDTPLLHPKFYSGLSFPTFTCMHTYMHIRTRAQKQQTSTHTHTPYDYRFASSFLASSLWRCTRAPSKTRRRGASRRQAGILAPARALIRFFIDLSQLPRQLRTLADGRTNTNLLSFPWTFFTTLNSFFSSCSKVEMLCFKLAAPKPAGRRPFKKARPGAAEPDHHGRRQWELADQPLRQILYHISRSVE